MFEGFIARVHQSEFAHPRVVVCAPAREPGIGRVVEEVCLSAGANEVRIIEQPLAAAMGAGLAVGEREGSLIADIGAAGTEIAVISQGGIVTRNRSPWAESSSTERSSGIADVSTA